MKKGYNFPLSGGGVTEGINDSGIEIFKGNPRYYLAKEIIQNSLDAHDGSDTPVKVSFKLTYINRNKFPYINDLEGIFKSCKDYWKDHKKTQEFIDEALNLLNQEKIPVLEAADYNTIGLVGAEGDENSCFNNLVNTSGVSNKDENAGGSFGIGKNAPFTCSKFRSIIYSTLDVEGVSAVQGVLSLVTHKKDGKKTQGRGFLGIEKENENGDLENLPFLSEEIYKNLNEYFIRKEVGTSLFVTGFKEEGWEKQIIESSIDYYFDAVVNGKLEVKVEDVVINKKTIGEILEKNYDKWENKKTFQYYKALTLKPDNKRVSIIENDDFMGLGRIVLYLYLESGNSNKIAYIRKNGMKIIDKSRIRAAAEFAGVLKFEGSEINKFIKKVENSSHDDLQYKRYKEDENYAKKTLSKLSRWIKKQILSLDKFNPDDVLDAGVGQYLPDERNAGDLKASVKEIKSNKIENVNLNREDKVKKTKKKASISDGIERKYSSRKRDIHKNDINSDKIKQINIIKQRAFCLDDSKGMYRIIVRAGNKGNTYIKLKIICEDGYEKAHIKEVKNANGQIIQSSDGVFGPVPFKKGQERKFDVILDSHIKYALEVDEDADNL